MAVTTQSVTAAHRLRPFNTLYTTNRFRTSEPWGECVQSGTETLNGGGAGNEARLRLFLPLPQGFVYRMVNGWWIKRGGDTSWGSNPEHAAMELFVGIDANTPAISTSQIDIPFSRSVMDDDPTGNLGEIMSFSLGSGVFNSSGVQAAIYQHVPLVYGYWDESSASGTTPVFRCGTATQNAGAGTFDYYFKWLAYNVEQAANSALHWLIPVT